MTLQRFFSDESWAISPDRLLALARGLRSVGEASALSTQEAIPVEGARRMSIRNGVAILPVHGPIVLGASRWFRGTSYEDLAIDFMAAMNDPAVRAVVLDVDSPGGMVKGISELSDLVFDHREAKPIVAYVGGDGLSAGYWLASSTSKIIASDTALLGGIGTVARFLDFSKLNKEMGVEEITIVSSQTPKKVSDPTTTEGRRDIQRVLDSITDVFIEKVARNRGVSLDDVLTAYGKGAALVGAEAVNVGMADRLGSFEGVVAELSGGATSATTGTPESAGSASKGEIMDQVKVSDVTREWLAEHCAELLESIVSTAHRAGADEGESRGVLLGIDAENNRSNRIRAFSAPGLESMIAECAADRTVTVEAALNRITSRQAEIRNQQLQTFRRDEADVDPPTPGSSSNASTDAEAGKRAVELARAHGLVS